MKKTDIYNYALEWQEKTGLYYLPRGKMPTEIPGYSNRCEQFTKRTPTVYQSARLSSLLFDHSVTS